ncbi:DUF2939 domain-containing protein [Asticcacaulis excentricus]|uniref:DUF2939 domain-containing protein n=1 Tax=Asticcacaulis excentricus (strain ATCC 15261 / DSM 4724 / KCTC 12464 / NCIMB 9791 / VKM B-1370 / CB 48) TaxID=573065 RepID=E8RUV8_ASTEC|nr:DUF2939 domain-containing protein [Asticcacaulis excentricus]ADU14158.1 hypothetical protein Astex_2507 [Asticcacaulis excentricus CB 48]
MFKTLSIAIIVAALAALFGFAIGPVWAFYDLRSAAESEDIQSLSELVAFDDVRASLKAQLWSDAKGTTTAYAPAPNVMKDPLGALGRAITDLTAPAPKQPVIDVNSYLTAKALLALSYGAGKDANVVEPREFAPKPPLPTVLYWSIDRARLGVKQPDIGTTVFTLKRKGLFTWQVTHIGLPDPEAEAAASASASSDFGPDK